MITRGSKRNEHKSAFSFRHIIDGKIKAKGSNPLVEVRVTRSDFRISKGKGGIGAAVVSPLVGDLRYSHGFIECLRD